MTMMQPESAEVSNSAERMRRHRRRKRQGVVCVVRVPIYQLDAEALVTRNRLRPDDQNDTAKIAKLHGLLVDKTEEVTQPSDMTSAERAEELERLQAELAELRRPKLAVVTTKATG